ncbi:recombination regulator RecX [Lactococcus sp. NH2-7C]|uniref:recombination regulator RecX n=1 Tax=Lactococcus sp. NH2-7C TaxID=2879149 RepID=UPI001CDD8116|nr:recombination regulator RecX [Lactococcus sp. NH2-7C]MCA2391033.1 recombination regulator RecX [Lactococcus sp. NH2-7C]WGV29259.1 recombination regulator RecX [Lactococcus sp. NH2-7C]
MGKIVAIKKLKHLYLVDLSGFDGEDEKIYISEDTIVHFFLNIDKEIEQSDLEDIRAYDQFARGKALALYYISFKMRTSSEVRRYLREHEIEDSEQIDEVINVLSENNLINDRDYAENYIEGKISMASTGPYQIKQKLMAKGIDASTISEALSNIYNEEKQIDIAYKLAEKLSRTHGHRLTLKQLNDKIIQNLMNKGFSYSISSIALESLELKVDEQNEDELLHNELEKIAKRYSKNYEGYERKQKITQALARKGFSYAAINSALHDYTFPE